MKKAVLNTLILVCICGVMALLLAVTNLITAPIIEANQQAAANEALLVVMPDGEFDADAQIDLKDKGLPEYVTAAYQEKNGGYVIQIKTAGYGSDLIIMCGVNAGGVVTGAVCLSSSETLGHEKTYGEKFIGKNEESVEDVAIVSGATLTTSAYKTAIADALKIAALLRGEDVDVRTHEEKLQDALPAAEGKFTKLPVATGDKIEILYAAENGAGYVCVIEDTYVGLNTEGKVITAELPAEAVTAAESLVAQALTQTAVDTKDTGIHENVTMVQKTADGSYLISVNGLGFGYYGDPDKYQDPKNIPMEICVLLTPEGNILQCLTVSHQESVGYGDVCGTEEYYGQYIGKTEADYKDVDAIAGATITTKGYTVAIQRAFAAVKILEGGSN